MVDVILSLIQADHVLKDADKNDTQREYGEDHVGIGGSVDGLPGEDSQQQLNHNDDNGLGSVLPS